MKESILANITKYIKLDPPEEEILLGMLRSRSLKKKERLVYAGELFNCLCYIRSGALKTFQIDEQGVEHVVQFAFDDWWAGDLFSFVNGKPALFYIDALEDTELWMLDRNQIEKLYQLVPKFERFFRILMQNSLIAHQKRINDSFRSGEHRYITFVNQYPHFEQRLTMKLIASYLGLTPESLSRIRRKLAGVKK